LTTDQEVLGLNPNRVTKRQKPAAVQRVFCFWPWRARAPKASKQKDGPPWAAGLLVSEFGAHQERAAILTGSLRDRSPLQCSGFFVGFNFFFLGIPLKKAVQ
jgi:hypothetical protein